MAATVILCRLLKHASELHVFSWAVLVFLLFAYSVWINTNTFTSITKTFHRNAELRTRQTKPMYYADLFLQRIKSRNDTVPCVTGDDIAVIITFSKAKQYKELQNKFKICVSSLMKETNTSILFYIIGDSESYDIAKRIMDDISVKHFRTVHLNVNQLVSEFGHIIKKMQKCFTSPGSYYSDPLFYLSPLIHRVIPLQVHKVIVLDADLKFQSDIKKLFELFAEFNEENIIGIARETQPVYRHAFEQYRKRHPGSRVGEPPPNGLTGFNSGVLLLDIDRMRASQIYNHLIDSDAILKLTEKYVFKGFLGDQDFFTLLSFEYEDLFYILPCTWNRQLCEWFRYHGYSDVFDDYFVCDGRINVYHGNCNTSFPA